MAGLASAAADLTYLFGRLVGDLLLGWRSGEGSRPRPSALLCEHTQIGPADRSASGLHTYRRAERTPETGAALPPDADFPRL